MVCKTQGKQGIIIRNPKFQYAMTKTDLRAVVPKEISLGFGILAIVYLFGVWCLEFGASRYSVLSHHGIHVTYSLYATPIVFRL
jgi:hypothetical protein